MAVEGELAAVICIEDPLREEAADVVKNLRRAGFDQVVMMTGDSEDVYKRQGQSSGMCPAAI